jgi:sugar (pentulose or hexulose) kinase
MNDDRRYVLAIDNGTQSIRTIIVDDLGNIVAKGRQELEPYFSAQPGWAEQHPQYYWEALGLAAAALWRVSPVTPAQISGVTLTTQRGTVICLDKAGQPLRPAIIWLDQRTADVKGGLGLLWDSLFRLAGVSDTVKRFREKAQINWVSQHQPEIWATHAQVSAVVGLSDVSSVRQLFRLHSVLSCVAYLPFDYKAPVLGQDISDWKWKGDYRCAASMLPDLVEPGQRHGRDLTDEAASAHTGFPEGLPLIAAASDKACEMIGSGGISPEHRPA